MKTRRLFAPVLALLFVAVAFGIVPRADEGFWPYNNIPKAAIKKAYGFEVTDAWLNHLQLATVRFGGGTGSVISPDGLVLTNHHIGLSSLQAMSNATGKDYVKDGFYAPTYADEWKVVDAQGRPMSLRILQSIEDVTAKVSAGVASSMSPTEAQAARDAAIATIQAESTKATGLESQVVRLYQGAVYNLYRYKVYTDVRLVFGVEYQTGFYGGDPDNFTYPRYCMDVSMFRLYENGKPAQTPNYLRFSPNGSKEGELVFTTGHPGTTQRLYTVSHLEYLRDKQLPYAIARNETGEKVLQQWASRSAENARQTVQQIFGIQNSLKSQRGQLKGLQDPALMAKKKAAEEQLRAALAKNPEKQKALGDAWESIDKSLRVARELDDERTYLVNAAGLSTSALFTQARAMVRAAYNPPAAGAGRGGRGGGRGGQAPGGAPAAQAGRGGQPTPTALEKLNLTASLQFMTDRLPATSPIVKLILGDKTPEERASELLDGTRLMDREIRTLLEAGGRATIDASTDPMIVVAREIEKAIEASGVAKRYEAEVTAVQAAAYPKIAQAVFAVYGPNAYPDATGTLRLSYGAVKGYMEDGRKVPPYTNIAGLFQRAVQHDNQMPYTVSPKWAEAKSALTATTAFNFVSTNDIVGGNSGSAVVNRKGEIVGLIFDGNIQSLPGYFIYDQAINRAVSVDSRLIVEALRKVYRADPLADEIAGKRRTTTTN